MKKLIFIISCLLLCSCQHVPMEIEWYESGQIKAVRYYAPGGTTFKIFCYDSGTHQNFNGNSTSESK